MNRKVILTKRGPIILALLFCTLLFGFYTFLYFASISWSEGSWKFDALWFDPADTAAAFNYSLAHNRIDAMKTIVDKKLWPFLDQWSTIHPPVSEQCKDPDDPDFGPLMVSSSPSSSGMSKVYFRFNYECLNFYTLSSTTFLKIIDGRWKVIGWEELCEVRSGPKTCYPDSGSASFEK